ncbi:MAG: formylglycine-generating enzyme family protein [Rhodobacteraceae bacterium]|nr:formylglycine-generating enzyme family protein [Paracoccaceae bacterium]MCF8520962.1 formylglycine-generating enzyme family protein [Paracoccaceae bacterium]
MVTLPEGRFLMGSNEHYPEEAPARMVAVEAFKIDAYAVTNDDFAAFVADSGYVTTSEIELFREETSSMPDAYYQAGSLVFRMTDRPVSLTNPNQWWHFVPGANWRHPEGPESNIASRGDHPVVHVSQIDALAYAAWAGKALPSEAQWEYAANCGDAGDNGLGPNIWRGTFPHQNSRTSQPPFTIASAAGKATAEGLFNMLGNVWEWTCDPFEKATASCCSAKFAPLVQMTLKGGSYLCAESYCRRYRSAARIGYDPRAATGHIGFRCVVSW